MHVSKEEEGVRHQPRGSAQRVVAPKQPVESRKRAAQGQVEGARVGEDFVDGQRTEQLKRPEGNGSLRYSSPCFAQCWVFEVSWKEMSQERKALLLCY